MKKDNRFPLSKIMATLHLRNLSAGWDLRCGALVPIAAEFKSLYQLSWNQPNNYTCKWCRHTSSSKEASQKKIYVWVIVDEIKSSVVLLLRSHNCKRLRTYTSSALVIQHVDHVQRTAGFTVDRIYSVGTRVVCRRQGNFLSI